METESNEIPIHWQTSLKCDNTSSRDRRSDCKERFAHRNLTEWETDFQSLKKQFQELRENGKGCYGFFIVEQQPSLQALV